MTHSSPRRRLLPSAGFLVAFLAWASSGACDDRVMVQVADQILTYNELRDEARFWRLSEADDERMERIFFALIDRRLLLRPMLPIPVTDEERARAVRLADEAIAEFARRYGGTEALHAILTGMEWDLARLRQFLERRALDNVRLRRAIESAMVRPTVDEVSAFERDLRGRGEPTALFTVRQIVLRFDPSGGAAARTAARERALDAILRIHNGAAFERVAAELSEDELTALAGGFVGTVSDRDVKPEFAAPLARLGVGALSDPIESGDAFYVFEMLRRRSPAQMLDAQRFAEARQRLLAEARQQAGVRFVDEELITLGFPERYTEYATRADAATADDLAGDDPTDQM